MKPEKIVFFIFTDNQLAVNHALLNAMEMLENEIQCKIVLEGEAVRLIPQMATPGTRLHELYQEARKLGLFDSVCHKCATRMGTTPAAEAEGLPMDGELRGHPSMTRYLLEGYQIITI